MKVSLEAGDAGTSLAVHWLRLRASTAQVQSLLRELRSYMLHGAVKKKKQVMDGEERKDKINTSKS